MKIVFVSNYFNHHQKPFCDEMHRLSGGNFTFISTQAMRTERRKLGYSENDNPDYVLLSYTDTEHYKQAKKLIATADIVFSGSAPGKMLIKRILSGKLLFRYAERPLKQKISVIKYLIYFVKWHLINPIGKPIYMFCASAYTAEDYRKFGLFKNRTYKWGYFPETKRYNDMSLILDNKQKTLMLWCGRFLDWKHPDDIIKVALRLKNDGYKFEMNVIGTGIMENTLSNMITEFELENYVHLRGAVNPKEVRESMEQSGIYLITSDRQEGWGAVLNEAMNSGCAVVASHEAGAVPFLIKDNENGLIYESGNVDMLYKKIKFLLDNPCEQMRLGKNAYHTIISKWNAEVAAERFWNLSNQIVSGKKYPTLYADGPCSKATAHIDN